MIKIKEKETMNLRYRWWTQGAAMTWRGNNVDTVIEEF